MSQEMVSFLGTAILSIISNADSMNTDESQIPCHNAVPKYQSSTSLLETCFEYTEILSMISCIRVKNQFSRPAVFFIRFDTEDGDSCL
jgi:hypothetical protein